MDDSRSEGAPPPADDQGDVAAIKPDGVRRCGVCGTKLSLYNPGPHCWQHTMGWPWRGPSARPHY